MCLRVEAEDSLQELVLPSAGRAPRMELKPLGGQQAPFSHGVVSLAGRIFISSIWEYFSKLLHYFFFKFETEFHTAQVSFKLSM